MNPNQQNQGIQSPLPITRVLQAAMGIPQEAIPDPVVSNAQQLRSGNITPQLPVPQGTQATVFPFQAQVTQPAGAKNPQLERFSGGKALDTSFATPHNVPIALPPGKFQVLTAFNNAAREGYVGDPTQNGYGNSVRVKDLSNGNVLHFLHLSNIASNVQPGQILSGGQIVANSGATGNLTGPSTGIELWDKNGNLGDITKSDYAKYLYPSQ